MPVLMFKQIRKYAIAHGLWGADRHSDERRDFDGGTENFQPVMRSEADDNNGLKFMFANNNSMMSSIQEG